MRVDRLDQLELELVDELDVAVDLLQHRIDDEALRRPARLARQIGIGAGYRVES